MKKEFLDHIKYDSLIYDLVLLVCSANNLNESEFETILKNIQNNYKLDDLLYNTFISFLGGEESLKDFLKQNQVVNEATESFMNRLDDVLRDELKNYIPDIMLGQNKGNLSH